ncbi:hypothetical protein [Kingella sp. (in: b-proteobacteria)]|nr:hypothetical protein [Kingella sp. (in: b-proteobacteria)]MDO4656768.1 hypothetical protein [Kingella sp. (in: b-proteobacteria)]
MDKRSGISDGDTVFRLPNWDAYRQPENLFSPYCTINTPSLLTT